MILFVLIVLLSVTRFREIGNTSLAANFYVSGRFLKVHFVFGNILNLLKFYAKFYAIGQIINVTNGQKLKK